MISDAEIEWLDSEMKYKLGFRDTVKIAEACLALIERLSAAEKERDEFRDELAFIDHEYARYNGPMTQKATELAVRARIIQRLRSAESERKRLKDVIRTLKEQSP